MRRKVLLADDSLSIQKMFGLYLEKCEIDVVTMSNGELAVSRLSAIRPDLILADVFMPGRTGYEICEYVKQHPDFKHIPVLLLTGKFEPYDEKEAKRVRADGHIVKPIAEQEFISLIRATLERFPPKPASTPPPPATQPVGQTQILGSVSPPAVPKEPSGLGTTPPWFHLGSFDPAAEVPPPTIKVTPAMLASVTSPPPAMDDGRLPDLEPLLPLDTPPATTPATDATDFILDLPPPEQAPPVLSYPEPPKTLSAPIPRPTFSSLPPPNIGTTTAKLDPAELPELLAAAPLPATSQAPAVKEADAPLELDDFVSPAVATPIVTPEPEAATVATPPVTAPDETMADFAPLPPAPIPEADTSSVDLAAAEATAAPIQTHELSETELAAPSAAALAPDEPSPSFAPVVTPPTQVAQPWEPPATATASPVTTTFQVQPETSSLPPLTTPLTAQPTGSLLTEPVPPPDFLTGLVSSSVPSPTVPEPPAASAESASPVPTSPLVSTPVPPFEPSAFAPSSLEPSSKLPEPSPEESSPLVSFSTLPTTAPPVAPVFEVVMEEEPPVRGTDLLPDELVALRKEPPATIEAAPAEVVSEVPAPPETDMAAAAPVTVEVTDQVAAVSPVAEEERGAASLPTETTSLEMAPVTDESAQPSETAPIPAFAPVPLEPVSPVVSDVVTPPAVEAQETEVSSVPEELPVAEVASAPALAAPPVASHTDEVSSEPLVETAPVPATESLVAPVAEPTPSTTTAVHTVDWSTFTLPPAVIDEIVRRVVAEISDHVVREIAWEVVPDLAELLIKKYLANGNGRRNADG